MTPGFPTYTLPVAAAAALSSQTLARLRPLSTVSEPLVFTLLDSFDHAVAGAHVALIETGPWLDLLGTDGRWHRQTAARRGDFITDLSDGPVRNRLEGLSPLRCLTPLCSGTAQQTSVAFVDEEEKTQARLRLVTLDSGSRNIALVTLSGLRGYDKALERLHQQIETLGGVPLARDAVYATLMPEAVPFVSRPGIEIAPQDSAFDTATAIISAHLPLARVNEPGVLDDLDTEFLKHYRVALRKVRSVLSLFKGAYGEDQTAHLKARFSALMAATGPLRDLDVYLLDRQGFYDHVPEALHGGLDLLFARFAQQRKRELARLRRHLRSKAYATEIERLEKLFRKRRTLQAGQRGDMAVGDFAAQLIWKRYRKICGIAAGITDLTPDDDVHELRIHCKKLRYLMEFFLPLYGTEVLKPLIKALKKLQTTLGDFNDHCVQQEKLTGVLDSLDPGAPEALEIAQSVGALIAVLHRLQLEERARVSERFAQFNSPELQAQFETLFHKGPRPC